MTSAFLGKYLVIGDILNATLAGGVVIGTSSGFLYQPSIAIAIGIVGGITSTLCFHFLTPIL
jgi:ammonia channel protein AmtB